MTNREQADYWLREAQHWYDVVKDAEDELEKSLRLRGISDQQLAPEVYLRAKDNFWYQRAGRKLETAEKRASMYALFALLEKGN